MARGRTLPEWVCYSISEALKASQKIVSGKKRKPSNHEYRLVSSWILMFRQPDRYTPGTIKDLIQCSLKTSLCLNKIGEKMKLNGMKRQNSERQNSLH